MDYSFYNVLREPWALYFKDVFLWKKEWTNCIHFKMLNCSSLLNSRRVTERVKCHRSLIVVQFVDIIELVSVSYQYEIPTNHVDLVQFLRI